MLTWGSAMVWAVPSSTGVAVRVTALAQSLCIPPAPCQAGSWGLSGRCWGHNCCPSLGNLCHHSRHPRAQGSDWSFSSGCLVSFVWLCPVSSDTKLLGHCCVRGSRGPCQGTSTAPDTSISMSSVPVAHPREQGAVSLCHIPQCHCGTSQESRVPHPK